MGLPEVWRKALERIHGLWLILKSFVALGAVDLRLRRHGFRTVLVRASTSPQPLRGSSTADRHRAARYVQSLERAARWYPRPARCLQRSLVLQHWLRREGVRSDLRIGVALVDGRLFAHAWVEMDGQVINDSPQGIARFQQLRSADELRQHPTAWLDDLPPAAERAVS